MENIVTIGTYRDPRDSIISIWRAIILDKKDLKVKMSLKDFKLIKKRWDDIINNYNLFKNKNNVFFVKYENFYNNFNYVYDLVEQIYNIKLSNSIKEKCCDKYKIENVSKYIKTNLNDKNFNGFHDKNTLLHNKHIFKGEIGGYKKYMKKELIYYINNKYTDLILDWGYKL